MSEEIKPKPYIPRMMWPFLSMAAMSGMMNNIKIPKDELDGIDIDEEYELIKQKKSKLSRRLRDRVVRLAKEYEKKGMEEAKK